jgi:hypothetical protein
MVAMATMVKRKAEMKAGRSPKFSMPTARAPRITVKLSHDRKVRSLAKKTLGSTRVGRAMRLPDLVGGLVLMGLVNCWREGVVYGSYLRKRYMQLMGRM